MWPVKKKKKNGFLVFRVLQRLPKSASGIVEALEEVGFDSLHALLSADRHDTDGLKMKKGHVAVVREAIKTLQLQHGEGPLRTLVSTGCGAPTWQDSWGLSPSRRKGHMPGTSTPPCRWMPPDRRLRVVIPVC